MKKVLIAVVVAALVIAGLVAVILFRFDPDALGARLIAQVNRQSGIQLAAERFSLHPLRGLEMTEATASGRVDAGDIDAQVKRLRMDYKILPLLRGELVIDEILLEEPVIVLSTRSTEAKRQQAARPKDRRAKQRQRQRRQEAAVAAADPLLEEDPGEPLRLSIEGLAVQNGTLEIRSRDDGGVSFAVAELNLALRNLTFDPNARSSTAALAGEGRLSTGRIVHGDLEAYRSAGQIRIADGMAELLELDVHSTNADAMVSELAVNLLEEPPSYALTAAGGIDLNGVLALEGEAGFGRVAMALAAVGEGPELEETTGSGTLVLNEGAIPGFPSVVQIEELLGQPLLTGRRYERTEIEYEIADNQILLAPFEIVAEGANLGGSGRIDLAGPLDLEIFVRLARGSLESGEMSEEELESLQDEEGMVTIPFAIAGTIDDPQVQLTWDGMKTLARDAAENWAEKALEEAKKRAAEWLRSQSDSPDDG